MKKNQALASLLTFAFSINSFGFNSLTHSQITSSAFDFMRARQPMNPSTALWLSGHGEGWRITQTLLVRADVDSDYKPDVWIRGIFHKPFVGGIGSTGINLFTTMFHHTNVVAPGTFWDHDGYAYRHTDGKGNDSLLATPTASIVGELSPPLEGYNYDYRIHGSAIGPYHYGFKGTMDDWYRMFRGNNDPTQAVFPPSNVVAQLAYKTMLLSERAPRTFIDNWDESLPLIKDLFSEQTIRRRYGRAEIQGLPDAFDQLGLALHLTQDLCMPHHTQGIASYCHPEMEAFMDQLTCGSSKIRPPTPGEYDSGTYDESFSSCQSLYDPALVNELLSKQEAFQTSRPIAIKDRLVQIALISAHWRWREARTGNGVIETVLPNGNVYRRSDCRGFQSIPDVSNQFKFQYNLAVAATVLLFELAAQDYETNRAQAIALAGTELPPLYFFWQKIIPGFIPTSFPRVTPSGASPSGF